MSNKMTVKDRLKTYRKHPGSFLVMLLVMLGALLTFSVLLFLIAYILINGVPHIKLSLFEWNYTSENASVVPALDPKTAEADACRIEHIISDESFDRLKEAAEQEQN